MRKITITESQYKRILESEFGYPLDVKSDDEKPENFTGYQVAVDNIDKDASNDVTTSDTIKRSKAGWFGMNRYPASHRLPEGEELDNTQNSGYGMKSDGFINNTAANGGGKMVNNVAAEVNSNTRGSRNNTNQVRVSRMENDKVNNPQKFQKNGGERMLNILKSQTKKTAASHEAKHSPDIVQQSTAVKPNGTGKKQGPGVVYFK